MRLALHATPEEVMRAVDALGEFGLALGIDDRTLFGLSVALEECGSNVVNHALGRDPRRTFSVIFEHTSGEVVLELRDDGPEFDPTKAPASDTEAADDRPPGGWGIVLVRRYTDGIHYAREGGENVLRLTKRIGSRTGEARAEGCGTSDAP
jgi:serine/threonine-protein kinase RsbW